MSLADKESKIFASVFFLVVSHNQELSSHTPLFIKYSDLRKKKAVSLTWVYPRLSYHCFLHGDYNEQSQNKWHLKIRYLEDTLATHFCGIYITFMSWWKLYFSAERFQCSSCRNNRSKVISDANISDSEAGCHNAWHKLFRNFFKS